MRKVIAVLGVLLTLYAVLALSLVPNATQVVSQPLEEGKLPDVREESCAFHAISPGAVLIWDGKYQLDGTVYAVNERYTEFYPLFLVSGRLLYRDEARKGADVCVIEERVAIKLFKTGEPLGRTLTLGEKDYTVVGVVRDAADIGAPTLNRVYVPYLSAKGSFETLVRTDTSFEEMPSGTVIKLKKEKVRATLLARVVAAYLIFSCLLISLRWLRRYQKSRVALYREALVDQYPRQLVFKFLPQGALVVLCWAALLAAGTWTLSFLLEPALVFPEWVPEVLVEWSSIADMFYKNVRSDSGAVILRTQELLRINHWGYVSNIGCIVVLLSIGRIGKKCKTSKE